MYIVRWLCIRKCNLGDTGLCYLTRPLINLPFQVLILESCGLSDKACPMLSSVLRAHEASRDVMAWNAFLRASPEELRSAEAWSERSQIQSSGLLLVSVKGNLVTSNGLDRLLEAVRTNSWLLGLKMSSNQISRRGMLNFVDGLSEHCGLVALVFDNNPGFNECIRSRIVDKLNPGSSVSIPEACQALLQRWKFRHTGLSTPTGDFAGTGSATMASTPVTTGSTPDGKADAGSALPQSTGERVLVSFHNDVVVEEEEDMEEALTPHSTGNNDVIENPNNNRDKTEKVPLSLQESASPPKAEGPSSPKVIDSEDFTEAEKVAVQEALRAKILQYMHNRSM